MRIVLLFIALRVFIGIVFLISATLISELILFYMFSYYDIIRQE